MCFSPAFITDLQIGCQSLELVLIRTTDYGQ